MNLCDVDEVEIKRAERLPLWRFPRMGQAGRSRSSGCDRASVALRGLESDLHESEAQTVPYLLIPWGLCVVRVRSIIVHICSRRCH